jgi:hypothetical protein
MFKQDDYIVCLKGDFTIGRFESSIARENYCVKQQQVSNKLYIYESVDGGTARTNGDFTFDKSKKLKNWRYATPQEAIEYERLGYPYDVTTLQPVNPEDTSYLIEIFAKNNIT